MEFDKRETATIIAALRFFQAQRGEFGHPLERPEWYPHFERVEALDDDEIDSLCERINYRGLGGVRFDGWYSHDDDTVDGVHIALRGPPTVDFVDGEPVRVVAADNIVAVFVVDADGTKRGLAKVLGRHYFRIVSETGHNDKYQETAPSDEPPTRDDWLEEAEAERFKFEHRPERD